MVYNKFYFLLGSVESIFLWINVFNSKGLTKKYVDKKCLLCQSGGHIWELMSDCALCAKREGRERRLIFNPI